MKKIAVVTFTTGFNYGNRLQNYAVQEIIKELGFEAETITDDVGRFVKLKKVIKHFVSWSYRFVKKINIAKLTEWERKTSFDKFNDKFIRFSSLNLFNEKGLRETIDEYDYYIVGSDQVWNPYFIKSDNYFLTFAPKEKKIAFSASIGINFLPDSEKERFKRFIGDMSQVSVREKRAADIIESLGLERPTLLVDPTLSLAKSKWEKLANNSNIKHHNKYIFCYFLGGQTDKQREFITVISKKLLCDVIDPLDSNNREYFSMDPSDFVQLIRDAQLVITDSFHGTVFSIIFHTPFYVYNRNCDNSMESRLDTLLDKFNLSDRRISDDCILSYLDLLSVDYDGVDNIIVSERQKTYDFLTNALKVDSDGQYQNL